MKAANNNIIVKNKNAARNYHLKQHIFTGLKNLNDGFAKDEIHFFSPKR